MVSAGGGETFLTGESVACGEATIFSPLASLTASPPAVDVTEDVPFVVTMAVAWSCCTPTCVCDSESTTIWLTGVRTVEASSVVATSTVPTVICTELLFFEVPALTCA